MKKILLLGMTGLLLLCSACFSPWRGPEDEVAFSINLGNGDTGRMAYPPITVAGYPDLPDLQFVIQFTSTQGGRGKTIVKNGLADSVIRDTIMRGVYNVTLDIYLLESPDEHYASGSTLAPVYNPFTSLLHYLLIFRIRWFSTSAT